MENQTQPAATPTATESLNPVIVPPNFDEELDSHLNKAFENLIPKQDEPKIEEPKKIEAKVKEPIEDKQDAKVESKKADKPVEVEKPTAKPDDIDKIDPKDKGAWGALKNANKNAHKIIEERDAEISKLKAVVAERGQMSQKELDALKAENGELSKYRAMIDIQSDPEFLSKFDQPIDKTVSSIKVMLKEMNVSDELISQIDFTNTKLMDEIINNVGEHKDKFVARKLQRKVEELIDLSDKRTETLAEHKEKYKETLEARKKEAFNKDTEAEGRALRHFETVANSKDKEGKPVFPFLNRIEPTETATQPEIDQINSHNRMVEMMQQKVQQAYKMDKPEERMEVAVAAAAAHYLSAQLRAVTNKYKSLEDELKKISAVNTETEKPKAASVKRNGNGSVMDVDEALASFNFQR